MLQHLITSNMARIRAVLRENKAVEAYAFGSVCTDRFNEKSDIDLLVEFEKGLEPIEYGERYWNIMFALEDLLKREVDLLTVQSIKNPYLKKEIDESKERIL